MPNRDFDPTTAPITPALRVHRESAEESSHAADPIDRVACRAGDDSCAKAHASTLKHSTASQPARASRSLLQLQRQYGNHYVERVLALARENIDRETSDPQTNDVSPDLEHSIQQKRGGGHGLDHGVRHQMESSLGANFGGVRIHTDHQADSLSRDLSARAFTTGQDIFFRQGAYDPASSGGRELIAHELTHVVQQGGDQVRRAMSVSQPSDSHEVEAEQTARAVMEKEVHRQPEAAHGKEKDEEEKKKHH